MSASSLEQKLKTLLHDIERFSTEDRTKALLAFVKSELQLMETTHNWTEKDLNLIRSRAANLMADIGVQTELEGKVFYQNEELVRTYCFAQATYLYMRNLGMTPFRIGIQHRKSAGICLHERVSQNAGDYKHRCDTCKVEVKPLLWVTVDKKS